MNVHFDYYEKNLFLSHDDYGEENYDKFEYHFENVEHTLIEYRQHNNTIRPILIVFLKENTTLKLFAYKYDKNHRLINKDEGTNVPTKKRKYYRFLLKNVDNLIHE